MAGSEAGISAASGVTDPSPALVRARTLHQNTREELSRADAKATTLLSVIGIVAAALIGGAIAGDWTPQKLALAPEIMGWSALVLVAVAETHLLLAVLPRIEHDKEYRQPRYFGHVVQMAGRDELRERLEQADDELEQAVDQIWVVGGIVDTKYRHVRAGLQFFAAGVVVVVIALLVDYCA
jgi:Family of unknown function (DUF5706)